MGDAGGCGREAGRYGERYDPFLHLSRGHYYTAQPCSGNLRHLPSLLTITCHFVSLLTVSSAHTKTKKPKSVNLCSAQLISAHLRRAHGQKTNKKTGPRSLRALWFPLGTLVSSTRKLISSSFHHLDMPLAVAEGLTPNEPVCPTHGFNSYHVIFISCFPST